MTFDETLYGRGNDDGDDLGDNESLEDVIGDKEELGDEVARRGREERERKRKNRDWDTLKTRG